MRICFFGDSFTTGTGDAQALGWVGRLIAQARQSGRDVTAYNLGIRGETSADILARWREEAARRLPADRDGRVVFCFGANDAGTGAGGQPRVTLEQTLANAHDILETCPYPVLVVGPPPVADHDETAAARLAALCPALARLCGGHGVPYLAVHAALKADRRWMDSARAGDGAHPGAEGYAAMAALIAATPPWRGWMVQAPPLG